MDYNSLPDFYAALDAKYNVTNNELNSATYTNVDCNFVYSAKYARHRWFNYKEGFSPILVEKIFDEYKLNKSSVVCDPFCGAGTTLAVAKAKGMKSIGFEVNPFAAFITKAKTEDYSKADMEEFEKLLQKLSTIEIAANIELPENEYLCRIFESEMLLSQLNIRKYINELPESKPKELLFFAWICTLEECALYRKAGNGLKVKRRPPTYDKGCAFKFAMECISKKAASMIEDFSIEDNGPIPQVYVESVTTMEKNVAKNTLDLVLFSPPYANCFDYTKIYYLELWFAGFVNSTSDQKNIRMNRYGITGNPLHLPESSSINKQITYGEYIFTQERFKREYGEDVPVYNAFLMPYNSARNVFGFDSIYGNIGEAKGDWKSGNHDYERVQGIVVDIRYLMYHYTGNHKSKIMQLAEAIEKAIQDNKQTSADA